MSDVQKHELMAVLCAREVHDWERIGVGANSPIPAAGGLLARHLWAPNVREAGAGGDAPFVGAKEFTDLIQRGKVDLFFFSAVQVDKTGSMNLQYIRTPDGRRKRFQGAYAAPIYYYSAKRTVIFRPEHSPRFFVDTVDHVTATAANAPRLRRHGTLTKIITSMAVLQFNPDASRLELLSVHDGYTFEQVQEATGFPLLRAEGFGTTLPPTEEELRTLRSTVFDEMEQLYPQFVAHMRAPRQEAS